MKSGNMFIQSAKNSTSIASPVVSDCHTNPKLDLKAIERLQEDI